MVLLPISQRESHEVGKRVLAVDCQKERFGQHEFGSYVRRLLHNSIETNRDASLPEGFKLLGLGHVVQYNSTAP